jgi:hypothetical protein
MVVLLSMLSIGCNQKPIDSTPDEIIPTLGVINITATEESRPVVTEKPTIKATEKPTEAPTEKSISTEATISETVVENETEPDYVPEVEVEVDIEITENYKVSQTETEAEKIYTTSSARIYSPSDFLMMGVIDWGNWTWTYYSENILPGYGLYLPGRHTDEDGYICDENEYICLASSSLPWGTIVETPFGKQGKVYDSGCAGYILDVYTSW